jgi:hypothetical protein
MLLLYQFFCLGMKVGLSYWVTNLDWGCLRTGCWGEYLDLRGSGESRDSSVGIALGYGLDDRGSRVRFSAGTGNFFFTTASRTALRPTQPPIQWVPGALSLGVKQPGHEADHSPPSSAEVREWAVLYLHSHNMSLWRGAQLKHRDNFNFKRKWLEAREDCIMRIFVTCMPHRVFLRWSGEEDDMGGM